MLGTKYFTHNKQANTPSIVLDEQEQKWCAPIDS